MLSDKSEKIIRILAGEWYVATAPNVIIATTLGSCVSACIRDPILGIGGMNHFLLPGHDHGDDNALDSARYGVFAMECLINGLLKANAQKHRLEFKIFGGGNVACHSARIGSKNAKFIRDFLKKEGFLIASEDLEGNYPRRVHYYPDTGKVMMRLLKYKEEQNVVEDEARFTKQFNKKPFEGDIELF